MPRPRKVFDPFTGQPQRSRSAEGAWDREDARAAGEWCEGVKIDVPDHQYRRYEDPLLRADGTIGGVRLA